MKVKVSISIDKETLDQLDLGVKNSNFRNRSHLIEVATKKLLGESK